MLRIITDSASDLPKDYIRQHNLHVIPTPVVIDDVDYFDGETIQTEEFYHILDDIKRDVKTYHINPAMFTEAFLPYAKAGDSIIYLCFSTGIAGTYNAANIAKSNILWSVGGQIGHDAGKRRFQGRNHRGGQLFYLSHQTCIYGSDSRLPDQGWQTHQIQGDSGGDTGYETGFDRK